MTTTIEQARRTRLRKPSFREVCLVGDPARRYVHLVPERLVAENPGLGKRGKAEDSGPRSTPEFGTG